MKVAILWLFAIGIAVAHGSSCVSVPDFSAILASGSSANCGFVRATKIAFFNDQIWVPACEADDTFTREQYHAAKNESFCVSAFGIEYENSRVAGETVNCTGYPAKAASMGPCDQATARLAEPNKNPFNLSPNCTANGLFDSIQTWTTWKWCTLADGGVLPRSHVQNADPDCSVHDWAANASPCVAGDTLKPYPGITGCSSNSCAAGCNRYINCGEGALFACVCPEGSYFNPAINDCDSHPIPCNTP